MSESLAESRVRPIWAFSAPVSRSTSFQRMFLVHGAGRFVILADTVLVRTGETVDILLDVTNPGRWMAHCHIAEHHESGMMLSFTVTD